jgi:hypothetical protein
MTDTQIRETVQGYDRRKALREAALEWGAIALFVAIVVLLAIYS